MKRVVPILLGVLVLAGAKKKAIAGGHHHASREQRRQHFEEKARAWHLREHEAMAD